MKDIIDLDLIKFTLNYCLFDEINTEFYINQH